MLTSDVAITVRGRVPKEIAKALSEMLADLPLDAEQFVSIDVDRVTSTTDRSDTEVLAYNIVNQLADLWGVDTDLRQDTNDRADQFVDRLISRLLPPPGTITLPVREVVQVVKQYEFFERHPQAVSRCRICNERHTHYGDDPADMTAEIVCRNHVAPRHGGTLHESFVTDRSLPGGHEQH
jgi:hypothetical protein